MFESLLFFVSFLLKRKRRRIESSYVQIVPQPTITYDESSLLPYRKTTEQIIMGLNRIRVETLLLLIIVMMIMILIINPLQIILRTDETQYSHLKIVHIHSCCCDFAYRSSSINIYSSSSSSSRTASTKLANPNHFFGIASSLGICFIIFYLITIL